MKQIYTTTLRLNLTDEDDRRAYEHLRKMDKKKYRSYSKAVVAAVNDYFERQERLATDPYLKTREKEDAFLRRVTAIIEQNLRFSHAGMLPIMPPADAEAPSAENDENLSAALDFADSF